MSQIIYQKLKPLNGSSFSEIISAAAGTYLNSQWSELLNSATNGLQIYVYQQDYEYIYVISDFYKYVIVINATKPLSTSQFDDKRVLDKIMRQKYKVRGISRISIIDLPLIFKTGDFRL